MVPEELLARLTGLWPLLLVMVIVVIALTRLRRRRKPSRYRLRKTLLTAAEQRFLPLLDKVAGPEARIMSPVRLADVLEPAEGLKGRERWRALGPILSKHLDFVVVDRRDARILYAVELDDRSHRRADRQRRDTWLNTVCAEAGLPLVRIPVSRHYDVEQLRSAIEAARATVTPAP